MSISTRRLLKKIRYDVEQRVIGETKEAFRRTVRAQHQNEILMTFDVDSLMRETGAGPWLTKHVLIALGRLNLIKRTQSRENSKWVYTVGYAYPHTVCHEAKFCPMLEVPWETLIQTTVREDSDVPKTVLRHLLVDMTINGLLFAKASAAWAQEPPPKMKDRLLRYREGVIATGAELAKELSRQWSAVPIYDKKADSIQQVLPKTVEALNLILRRDVWSAGLEDENREKLESWLTANVDDERSSENLPTVQNPQNPPKSNQINNIEARSTSENIYTYISNTKTLKDRIITVKMFDGGKIPPKPRGVSDLQRKNGSATVGRSGEPDGKNVFDIRQAKNRRPSADGSVMGLQTLLTAYGDAVKLIYGPYHFGGYKKVGDLKPAVLAALKWLREMIREYPRCNVRLMMMVMVGRYKWFQNDGGTDAPPLNWFTWDVFKEYACSTAPIWDEVYEWRERHPNYVHMIDSWGQFFCDAWRERHKENLLDKYGAFMRPWNDYCLFKSYQSYLRAKAKFEYETHREMAPHLYMNAQMDHFRTYFGDKRKYCEVVWIWGEKAEDRAHAYCVDLPGLPQISAKRMAQLERRYGKQKANVFRLSESFREEKGDGEI